MNKREDISMYRKLLGYRSGNKKQPVYAPMPGALVTQALILCSQCRATINSQMGPHRDTWCIPCTEKEAIEAPKREARKQETLKKEKRKALEKTKEEQKALEKMKDQLKKNIEN